MGALINWVYFWIISKEMICTSVTNYNTCTIITFQKEKRGIVLHCCLSVMLYIMGVCEMECNSF